MCNRCNYDSPDNQIYIDPLTNEYYLDIETFEWDEYDDDFVHQREYIAYCPYCGQPYKNQGYMHCDCEGQKKADEEERIKKWNDKVSKAVPVDEKDVNTMLYCEEFDEYYDTVDDFFDDYFGRYTDEEFNNDGRPERLWVCSVEKIHIDADNVVDNACEELHEDAYEQCDIGGLQNLLDTWCKDQTGATTYYPCYKQYVEINWSEYEDCSR